MDLAQQDLEPLLVGVDAHFEAVLPGESGAAWHMSEFVCNQIKDGCHSVYSNPDPDSHGFRSPAVSRNRHHLDFLDHSIRNGSLDGPQAVTPWKSCKGGRNISVFQPRLRIYWHFKQHNAVRPPLETCILGYFPPSRSRKSGYNLRWKIELCIYHTHGIEFIIAAVEKFSLESESHRLQRPHSSTAPWRPGASVVSPSCWYWWFWWEDMKVWLYKDTKQETVHVAAAWLQGGDGGGVALGWGRNTFW